MVRIFVPIPAKKGATQMKKWLATLSAVVLVFAAVPANASNLQSPVTTVNLSFNVSESISVSATPGSISFDLTGTASGPISVTTSWSVVGGQHNAWATFIYFTSANALTNSGPSIPTSAFNTSVNGGAASPCTQTGSFTDGSGHAYTNPVANSNNCSHITYQGGSQVFGAIPLQGSQTDSVLPSITNSVASNAQAGGYTGTLNLIAVVQ
jgi:hypothetical protein